MVQIGSVEIPIVNAVEEVEETSVDETTPLPAKSDSIDNVAVKHEPSVQTVRISGYLNEDLHSESLPIAEQKEEVKTLRTRDVTDNPFSYLDYYGYLLIENIDLTDNSDSRIVNEVTIDARYHPWPKYFTEVEPLYQENTSFGEDFGRYFGV